MGLVHNPSIFGFVWILSLLIFSLQEAVKVLLLKEIMKCHKRGCCSRRPLLPSTFSSQAHLRSEADEQTRKTSPNQNIEEYVVSMDIDQRTSLSPDVEEAIPEPVKAKDDHVENTVQTSASDNDEFIDEPLVYNDEFIDEPLVYTYPAAADVLSGRLLMERFKNDAMLTSFPLAYLEECTNVFDPRRITSAGKGGFGSVYYASDNVANVNFLVQKLSVSVQVDALKVSSR